MPRRAGQPPLTAEAVVDAAWALVDAHGLEALSLRKLAAALGVEAPSLYHVIPHKQALVDALFAGLVGRAPPVPEGLPWDGHLRALAQRWLRLLRPVPAFATLALSRPPRAAPWLAEAEAALAVLRAAGFTATEAIYAYKSVLALVAGVVLNEAGPAPSPALDAPTWTQAAAEALPAAQYPTLTRTLADDHGRQFDTWLDLGLDLLVDGLRVRLARRCL